MTSWFISDLHLSPARPDITRLFFAFLQEQAVHADALYILGDLFDAWIGDDDTSDFAAALQGALRQLTQTGVPVFFIAGNRDFLIGARFARATGVRLLTEPAVIDLYGTRTLLLHGDSLCTADRSYQRFRRIIRQPWLTRLLLALPLRARMRIANKLRASSATQQPLSAEQLAIMDVTEQAVIDTFVQYDVRHMIHGHTHRPAIHEHQLPDGSTAERIVLGDWYEQGSFLRVTRNERELISQPLTL
ncbi:UDP-2,3-diacylglucosamine hydrolase [Pseudidiomarina salinarum]|uniref:UDP-2,3-diacylglucosamine hydrolase n=1 Tax=Pseudidiomarina salinarum TaxID=435908 RepID=A0A094IWH7_9GAMM|nr:UDP-2,3-diacylglucosamine diphosphatase [Pseudidiomarina salinarum]KFZ31457.1 UDP-2,3-diacylglucosamine hydrolase [Pseudidiomarina salinarum]RUO70781.1 UDP-2,3-diacylglucosamine diphosphatase [Pseudidiomarina salinarum]